MSGPGRIAKRLGVTEGQLYTISILTVLSMFVFSGMRELRTDVGTALAASPIPTPTVVAPSPTAPPVSESISVAPETPPPPRITPTRPAPPPPPSSGTQSEPVTVAPVRTGPLDVVLDDVVDITGIAARPGRAALIAAELADGPPVLLSIGSAGGRGTVTVLSLGTTEGDIGGVDVSGETAYVVDTTGSRVLAVDLILGSVTNHADIPDLPPCVGAGISEPACEQGLSDNAPQPIDLVVDPDGNIYVTDGAQGVIWRVRADRSVELWHQSFDYATNAGLTGIAREQTGAIVVIGNDATSSSAIGSSAIHRFAVDDDGNPGERETFFTADSGVVLTDLDVLATGGIVVAAPSQASLLVVVDGVVQSSTTELHGNALVSPVVVGTAGLDLFVGDELGEDRVRVVESSPP